MPETRTGLDAHAGQEEHQPDFTQQEVRRRGGVRDQVKLVAVASGQNSDNQRSAGQTEFHRVRNAGEGKGDTSEYDADEDADKDRRDVWVVEAFH